MSRQYFITSENTLIFQFTASLLKEMNGYVQRSDTDVIISIKETIIDDKPCFKASYIDANMIKGNPFSDVWLANLKSFSYGQPVTARSQRSDVKGQMSEIRSQSSDLCPQTSD